MSRSNGTADRHAQHPAPHPQGRGTQPADPGQSLPWHQQAADPHAHQQSGLFAQPQQAPQPYPQQAAPQGYYPNQPGYPAGADPYYGHYFNGAQAPQGYAPAPQGYGQQQLDPAVYAQAQSQAAAAARAAGFPPQHPHGQPQQPYADPRGGYDLGGYATQQPGYPQGAPQGYAPQHYDQQPQFDAYDPNAPHAHHQGQLPHGQHPDDGLEDEEEYEDEIAEPKSRGRGIVVVASLIGAIALGAGLAYGYKKFGGGPGGSKPPVLKAEQTPAKARTAAADQKLGERLDQPPPVVAGDSSASANPGGPRVVQTIPISPAGTVIANAPPPQPQAPLRPTISVPGVQLENSAAPQPPQYVQPQVTPAPVGRAVAPPPLPAQPRVIASAEPAVSVAPPPARVPVAKAAAKAKTPDAYQAPGGAAPAATVAAATAAPSATTVPKASNGYVAVLSSQGTRMEALKAYADLQQKYAGVLASKPADVQEATVNGKVWFRAVVGPPGSRNAAVDLCTQLKSAGHSACFPAAY